MLSISYHSLIELNKPRLPMVVDDDDPLDHERMTIAIAMCVLESMEGKDVAVLVTTAIISAIVAVVSYRYATLGSSPSTASGTRKSEEKDEKPNEDGSDEDDEDSIVVGKIRDDYTLLSGKFKMVDVLYSPL